MFDMSRFDKLSLLLNMVEIVVEFPPIVSFLFWSGKLEEAVGQG
jgi:hypothetical protein